MPGASRWLDALNATPAAASTVAAANPFIDCRMIGPPRVPGAAFVRRAGLHLALTAGRPERIAWLVLVQTSAAIAAHEPGDSGRAIRSVIAVTERAGPSRDVLTTLRQRRRREPGRHAGCNPARRRLRMAG